MTCEWSLRTAQPVDVHTISALLERCYPQTWKKHYTQQILVVVLPLVTRANPRLLASGRFLIAVAEEETVVGCGGWSPEWPGSERADSGLCHARHFATDPRWLGKGIGRAILNRCIEQAKAAGFTAMLADAARGAENFYAALGFESIEPGNTVMGGVLLPSTMMKRQL